MNNQENLEKIVRSVLNYGKNLGEDYSNQFIFLNLLEEMIDLKASNKILSIMFNYTPEQIEEIKAHYTKEKIKKEKYDIYKTLLDIFNVEVIEALETINYDKVDKKNIENIIILLRRIYFKGLKEGISDNYLKTLNQKNNLLMNSKLSDEELADFLDLPLEVVNIIRNRRNNF